jgi:hypothetical protein
VNGSFFMRCWAIYLSRLTLITKSSELRFENWIHLI